MALIKTDSQNYTDIADSIRELLPEDVLFDGDVTTDTQAGDSWYYLHMPDYVNYYNMNEFMLNDIVVGETWEVTVNGTSYQMEMNTFTDGIIFYYVGNGYLVAPTKVSDTGESFAVSVTLGFLSFHTKDSGTYNFKVVRKSDRKRFKPSEMSNVLDDCGLYGVSYNSDGSIATTHGYKVAGMMYNSALTTVNISNNATEIAERALLACGITSISFPNGLKKIGSQAFQLNSITELTIPASVEEIDEYAFSYNYGLTTVTFKGTPTKLDESAFAYCIRLTTINVPWSEGEIAGAPWGSTADNVTINYNQTT